MKPKVPWSRMKSMLAVKHQPDTVRFGSYKNEIVSSEPIQTSSEDSNAQQSVNSVKDSRLFGFDKEGIRDAAALEQLLDELRQRNTEKTRHFIARCIALVFVAWTLVGLLEHFTTGNSTLLVSDVGPGALFSIVVHRYLGDQEK